MEVFVFEEKDMLSLASAKTTTLEKGVTFVSKMIYYMFTFMSLYPGWGLNQCSWCYMIDCTDLLPDTLTWHKLGQQGKANKESV